MKDWIQFFIIMGYIICLPLIMVLGILVYPCIVAAHIADFMAEHC